MMFLMRTLLSVSFVTALAGCSLTPLYERGPPPRPVLPTPAARRMRRRRIRSVAGGGRYRVA